MHRQNQRQKIKYRYAVTVFDTITGHSYCVLANSLDEIVDSTLFAVDKLKEKEKGNATGNNDNPGFA